MRDLELNILRRWHESVDRDIAAHPFCEGELEKVSEKYRGIYCDEKSPRRKKAYGTTLIAICVTEDYWFGLQIGDGKCFAVGWDGACTEPIPWDEDCQGNITTSICDTNAMEEFRFFWDSLWRFSSVATAWMTLTPETMNSTIYTARFFVCSPKRVPKPEWRKSGNSCL